MTAVPPPVTGPDPLAVECVVAAIGIEPFVSKELRRVYGYHQERSSGIPAAIDRQIYRFIQREEPAAAAALPDFDYDEVKELLEAETLPAHVQAQIAAFGEFGDLALAVNVEVQRIVKYLQGKLPKRVHMSLAGPEYTRPPESDIARFARTWAIACDPMGTLDDLNEYALSRDQVASLADLYPLLWKYISAQSGGSVTRQLARAVAQATSEGGKFHLLRQKETLLRVLVKNEAPNIPLGKAMQAMYAAINAPPQAKAPAAPMKSPDESASSEATAAQQIH
jgi:hypothetical protein